MCQLFGSFWGLWWRICAASDMCGSWMSISLVITLSVLCLYVLYVSVLWRHQSFWLGTFSFNLDLVIGKDPVLVAFLVLWSSIWQETTQNRVYSGLQFKGKQSIMERRSQQWDHETAIRTVSTVRERSRDRKWSMVIGHPGSSPVPPFLLQGSFS